jgi:2-keto-3-deoxy-6-phosphogluconate aldolase
MVGVDGAYNIMKTSMSQAWEIKDSRIHGRLDPTGDTSLQNAPEFLGLPNALCGGGSWLVSANAMAASHWRKITQLAADEAVWPE